MTEGQKWTMFTRIPAMPTKLLPAPTFGHSDHISVLLIPSYTPVQKHEKPTTRNIKVWPERASSAQEDCFDCTYRNVFQEAATHSSHTDLDEDAASVTGFISKCVDDGVLTRTIAKRPNQWPWLNVALRAARTDLTHGIKRRQLQNMPPE